MTAQPTLQVKYAPKGALHRLFDDALEQWGQLRRKRAVFVRRLTLAKLYNLSLRLVAFALRRPGLPGLPVHLKIDVAPQCQLRCKVCQHSASGVDPDFHAPAIMRNDVFEKVVNDVAGKTFAMALYNLGEPLLNPNLYRMIRYAEARGINTYFTTNLSLRLKDQQISEMIDSGASLINVGVDGISEGSYGQQRVGGNWNLVRDNIIRLGEYKAQSGQKWPHLVLQYLTFDFNEHEKAAARKFAADVGFDGVQHVRGDTRPWRDLFQLRPGAPHRNASLLPHCTWPYFSMVVNSSGEVSACCISRMDDYHRLSAVPRSMGNVLKENISSIYANASYQKARRLSNDPKLNCKDATGHFCEGCGKLARA